jgi:hypothetical protein
MFALSLLLTTGISIWIALRRHPLYTWDSTLRIAGGTLLLILACAGLMVLAVWLTAARSETALFLSIFGALIAGCLGITYGFNLITPPNARLDTRLPPSVAPVIVHRRALRRWWRPALAFAGLCALDVLIPGPSREIGVVLALTVVVPAAIGIPAWYVTARQLDRAATALQLDPWLHWHYSPEARAAWIDVQRERLRAAPAAKLDWKMAWLCVPVLVALLMFIVDGRLPVRTAWGLGLATLVIAVLRICEIVQGREPDRVERRMRAAAPDAYFGHDGVFCDDRFLTWLDTKQYLVRASVDERTPRSVALVLMKIGARGQTVTLRQDILIPATANQADLELLQSALRARCPSAHVQLLAVEPGAMKN